MARNFEERGFTLIEITFAVLILAAAMTTLLGLQFSTLQREYRDQNMQRAMLVARRVLAHLETEELALEPHVKDLSVPDFFDEYAEEKIEDKGGSMPALSFADMNAHISVENWTLPESEHENDMRKVYLRISWGNGDYDYFETVYFVPAESAVGRSRKSGEEEDG